MLRCAITDISRQGGTPGERREALLRQVRRLGVEGVDFVQLREKALPAGELLGLAEALVRELADTGCGTRLLVNTRADVAVAAGAHGVHLSSAPGELTSAQVRRLFAATGRPDPVVGVSCHSLPQISAASAAGADFLLFGPVFEKVVGGTPVAPAGSGLDLLRQAVAAAGRTPVLALGGVTAANTPACLAAGAAGIAGIRMFGFEG